MSFVCDLPPEAYDQDEVWDEKYVILRHKDGAKTVLLSRPYRFHSQIVDACTAQYGRDWDVRGGGIIVIDNEA